jgi:transcription elongation factor Elf1
MIAGNALPQPEASAAAMLFTTAVAGWRLVRRLCRRPRRRNALRRCPLCRADAVAGVAYETVDVVQVRVLLQCGQCGAWREILTVLAVVARYERMVEADRRLILHQAEELEHDRTLVETAAGGHHG